MGIQLTHSKPGQPAGRGKIERVFRTVREQFLIELAAPETASLQVADETVPQEHGPVAVDWGRFLPEHTTAAGLLDRLLHHATTVVTSGESYRMRDARTNRGGPKNKS